MARALTVKFIENIQPKAARIEVPDGAMRGLFLIVQPTGAKSWAVRYRLNGKPDKFTLGSYERLGLAGGRDAAEPVLRLVSEGKDPKADHITIATLKRQPAPLSEHRFEKVLERFTASQRAKGRRSADEVARMLDKDATPYWRGRPIASITAAEVVERIEAIVKRGAPVTASRFRAWCSKLFSYAVKAQLRPDNPAKETDNPVDAKSRRRTRKLSDRELVLVWDAAAKLGYPFGPAVRLLILTGQRRDEIFEMPWAEFDLEERSWTIQPARSKNNVEHWNHLPRETHAILAALPVIEKCPYVFTTTGDSPVSGFSRMKTRLDALIAEANGGKPIPHWTLHDLRRTFASGLAGLGIPLQVCEKLLNHQSGSLGGIAGVYNVHEYKSERIAALTTWAGHVTALVQGKPAKVVRLRTVA